MSGLHANMNKQQRRNTHLQQSFIDKFMSKSDSISLDNSTHPAIQGTKAQTKAPTTGGWVARGGVGQPGMQALALCCGIFPLFLFLSFVYDLA